MCSYGKHLLSAVHEVSKKNMPHKSGLKSPEIHLMTSRQLVLMFLSAASATYNFSAMHLIHKLLFVQLSHCHYAFMQWSETWSWCNGLAIIFTDEYSHMYAANAMPYIFPQRGWRVTPGILHMLKRCTMIVYISTILNRSNYSARFRQQVQQLVYEARYMYMLFKLVIVSNSHTCWDQECTYRTRNQGGMYDKQRWAANKTAQQLPTSFQVYLRQSNNSGTAVALMCIILEKGTKI